MFAVLLLAGLLKGELISEGGSVIGDGTVVAFVVDPCGSSLHGRTIEFGKHVKVASVSSEKDVARQGVERNESVFEV